MTGFIGRSLALSLLADGHEVIGTGVSRAEMDILPPALRRVPVTILDMRDRPRVDALVESTRPDTIYHLAGQAYVIPSYDDPIGTFEINVLGTIALLEAVRRHCPDASVAVACSGASYGMPRRLPIPEDHPLEPVSPYGVSKASQDLIAHQYNASFGLRTFRLRLFGTTGPGKRGDAPNDFAAQLALAELNGGPGVVRVGDLSRSRDISDVRDVVTAMRIVESKGIPGEAYNIGRGSAVVIQHVLDTLLSFTDAQIRVEVAPERLRPVDEPILFADVTKMRSLGWTPRWALRDTLADVLDYWREHSERIPPEEVVW